MIAAQAVSIPLRSSVGRIALALALSVLSGVLLTLSFAPYNLWLLAFVAFIPLIVAQMHVMPPRLSSIASGVMIAVWLFLYFGPTFFEGGVMLLLPIIGFVVNTVTERGLRAFHERSRFRWFVVYGVVNWVAFEIIRTFIPGIATWGFVGYTLWSQPALIQPIAIVGIYGLSALIMAINYVIGQAVLLRLDPSGERIDPRQTRRWLIGVMLAAIAWVGVSLALYAGATDPRETVRVAAVQPGFTDNAFSNPDLDRAARIAALSDATRDAAAQGAQLIVWSELVLPFDPQVDYREALRALASETGAYLVLPYGVITPEGARNEATTLTPNGEFLTPYAKARPVLFAGEPVGLNVGTFPVHDTAIGRLATVICYDLNYTDITRQMATQGAQIIAVPSNDWRGIAEKQNIHLVFRAIETRTSLVKAETAYDSAIVDPYGHIVMQTVSLTPESALLVADVPLGGGGTPYLVIGDALGYAAIAALIALTIYSERKPRVHAT